MGSKKPQGLCEPGVFDVIAPPLLRSTLALRYTETSYVTQQTTLRNEKREYETYTLSLR